MVDGANADIYCKTDHEEASSRPARDIGNQRKRTREPTSGHVIELLGNRGCCENQAATWIQKLRCCYLVYDGLNRHRAGVIVDGLIDPGPGRHLVPAIQQLHKVPERPGGLEDGRRQYGATDGLHGVNGRNGAFRDVAGRHVANLEPSVPVGGNDCLEGGDLFLGLVDPARAQLNAGSRTHDFWILLRHADAAGDYGPLDSQAERRILLPSSRSNRESVNDFLGDPSDDEASDRRRTCRQPSRPLPAHDTRRWQLLQSSRE